MRRGRIGRGRGEGDDETGGLSHEGIVPGHPEEVNANQVAGPDPAATSPSSSTSGQGRNAGRGRRPEGMGPSSFGDVPLEFSEEDRSAREVGELDSYMKKPGVSHPFYPP